MDGTLRVAKTTYGGTADQMFQFSAHCTIGGGDVTFDTLNTTFTLARDGVKEFPNLIAGSFCVVTESDPGAGWMTSTQVNDASPTANSREARVSIVSGQVALVGFSNEAPFARLTVAKSVVGGGDKAFGFHVECTEPGPDGTVLMPISETLDLSDGASRDYSPHDGATCTATELDEGAEGYQTTIAVNDTQSDEVRRTITVTLSAATPTVLTFRNQNVSGPVPTPGPATKPSGGTGGTGTTTPGTSGSTPPSTPAADVEGATTSRQSGSTRLPRTGADIAAFAAMAALLADGGALVLIGRRRT